MQTRFFLFLFLFFIFMFLIGIRRRRPMRASTTGWLWWWRVENTLWATRPCSRPLGILRVVVLHFCTLFFYFDLKFISFCWKEGYLWLYLYVCILKWEIAGKLILISNNCPPLRKSEIEYYAMLAKVGVHHYNGSKHPFLFSPQLISNIIFNLTWFISNYQMMSFKDIISGWPVLSSFYKI